MMEYKVGHIVFYKYEDTIDYGVLEEVDGDTLWSWWSGKDTLKLSCTPRSVTLIGATCLGKWDK